MSGQETHFAGTVGISAGVGLVLGFLRERATIARRLADKTGQDDSILQDRARQLEIIIGDIEAGMHLPDMVGASGVALRSFDGLRMSGAQGERDFEEKEEAKASDVDGLAALGVEPGATGHFSGFVDAGAAS